MLSQIIEKLDSYKSSLDLGNNEFESSKINTKRIDEKKDNLIEIKDKKIESNNENEYKNEIISPEIDQKMIKNDVDNDIIFVNQ